MIATATSTSQGGKNVEHVDVAIIGAGLSGIGAACYLRMLRPRTSFVLLESRDRTGGTWDFFKFPGCRSDSDLPTFGYEFKPWTDRASIASADKVLRYLRDTATQFGINDHIRLRHRATAAAWSPGDNRWTITVEREQGTTTFLQADWIFCAGGYYRYDGGNRPAIPRRELFTGPVVHAQSWPADLDVDDKTVAVIGSGATAVTMVPALAARGARVIMVQRSPSYILPVPSTDRIAESLRKVLGARVGHRITRGKNIFKMYALRRFCQQYPRIARRFIRAVNAHLLPPGFPVDRHFQPRYNPWEQRLCLVPDGDFFTAIRAGKASVVTDQVASFTATGLRLQSGEQVAADIIVTATGFNLQACAGMAVEVDGKRIHIPDRITYKSMMLDGVPNFTFAIGYPDSTWTLKIGLLCQYFCRLLEYMDEHQYAAATPILEDRAMPTKPQLDLSSGYMLRGATAMPRQGVTEPWRTSNNYHHDRRRLRKDPIADNILKFTARQTQPDAVRNEPAAVQ